MERVDTYKYLGVFLKIIIELERDQLLAEKSKPENVLHEKAEIIWSKFKYASNFL